MNSINIKQELDTPHVTLSYEDSLIEFIGKSYPDNAFTFYEPIIKWITQYFNEESQTHTTINIKLIYFNSSTNQILYNILDIVNNGVSKPLQINWYYHEEDEDSLEDYEDIAEEFPDLNIQTIIY
ncbi:MAG: hypothetical protein ACI9TV_001831 [Sulfurimonas sp.]|jgi:hypothetical protein|uniref:DUF1987 domain-containing protein n=1 Tax=Sulfurimonas sp. TaxID=2022749 RepID=UPI0039E45F7C